MKHLLIIAAALLLLYELSRAKQAGVSVVDFPRWFLISQGLGFGPGTGHGAANDPGRYEYGRPNVPDWSPWDSNGGQDTFFYSKHYQTICPAGSSDPAQCRTVLVSTETSPGGSGSCAGCSGPNPGSLLNPEQASQNWLKRL